MNRQSGRHPMRQATPNGDLEVVQGLIEHHQDYLSLLRQGLRRRDQQCVVEASQAISRAMAATGHHGSQRDLDVLMRLGRRSAPAIVQQAYARVEQQVARVIGDLTAKR
jgi:uncharacterized protein (DUF305 family)